MKRFVFPLERIRAWNAMQLQIQEAALEGLLDQARRAEADYQTVLAEKTQFEEQTLRQPLIESNDLERIGQFRKFVISERRRFEAAQTEFARKIAERRGVIVELKRKIELLDRLRERQRASWAAEESKELQANADEAFLQRLVAKRHKRADDS
jgi:hypothetical protein